MAFIENNSNLNYKYVIVDPKISKIHIKILYHDFVQ